MIHARKTVSRLPYSVIWFPDEGDVPRARRLTSPLVVVRQGSLDFLRRFEDLVVSSRRFCTAGTDLTQDEDRLLAQMHKTCRYRVGRGLRLDHGFAVGAPTRFPSGRRLIDAFNERKFGRPVGTENWALVEQHGCLTQVTLAGQVICANTYLIDGTRRARALFGASVPNEGEGHSKQTVAFLSRAHIWRDMLYFKRLGVRLYDLGGLFDDPHHPAAGIDQYKLSFGLQKFYEYHALASPYRVVRSGLGLLGREP